MTISLLFPTVSLGKLESPASILAFESVTEVGAAPAKAIDPERAIPASDRSLEVREDGGPSPSDERIINVFAACGSGYRV